MPIIQLLLRYGADIHARNGDNNCTALHAAAGCGDISIVQLLLENGSDINSRTKNGSTALHLALQHGDIETAKPMTENGIDIAPRTKILHHFDHNPCISDGASALYLAVRWGHESFARKLLAKGARVDV
jgi:ankyrin repeat protein